MIPLIVVLLLAVGAALWYYRERKRERAIRQNTSRMLTMFTLYGEGQDLPAHLEIADVRDPVAGEPVKAGRRS